MGNGEAQALDVISLAGAASSYTATVKIVFTLRNATHKSFLEILKGLNRTERKRLTEEIIRINHPGISNGVLKQLVRKKSWPTRYSTVEINQTTTLQLKDALGATLSITGSVYSGAINSIAVGIYEEMAIK